MKNNIKEKTKRGIITSTPADRGRTRNFMEEQKRLSVIPISAIVKKAKAIDMITEAIQAVALPRKGASFQAIKKWIFANKSPKSIAFIKTLKRAILKGIEAGVLVRPRHCMTACGATGSFALSKNVNKSSNKAAVKSPKTVAVKSLKEGPVKSVKKDPVKSLKKDPVKALKKDPVKSLKKDPVKSLKKGPVKSLKKDPVKSSKKTIAKSPEKTVMKSPKGKTKKTGKNSLTKMPLKGASNKIAESPLVSSPDISFERDDSCFSFMGSEKESLQRKEQSLETVSKGKARTAKINRQENSVNANELNKVGPSGSKLTMNEAAVKNFAESEPSRIKRGKKLDAKRTAKQDNLETVDASKIVDVAEDKAEDQTGAGNSKSVRHKKLYASKNISKPIRKDLSDTELEVNTERPKSLKSYSSDTELDISKRKERKEMSKIRKIAKIKTAEDIYSTKRARKDVTLVANVEERDNDDKNNDHSVKPQNRAKKRKGQ